MRTRLVITGLIVIVIAAVAGCAPAVETAIPTEPPTIEVEPTEADPATEEAEAPALIPITAPDVEVGSTYYYADGTTLVAVPSGEFVMGGDDEDNAEHSVSLNDYWMYSTKVTNQQYALCVSLGHCTPPNDVSNPSFENIEYANNPVVGVTHDQAAAYCSFVNGRLPTEAEWEKAARGPDGNLYPWGAAEPSCGLLNFNSCLKETSNVVLYSQGASYYGALDMAGNVFEWVADWYDAGYYSSSPEENPTGPEEGNTRVVRASGYESNALEAAVIHRFSEEPQNHREDLGFRCVVDEPATFAPFCEAPLVHDNQRATASVTCPEVSIEQYPACAKKLSTTNVVFIGPDDAYFNTGGCAPTDDPKEFSCLAAGQVSISATCQVEISGDPACAPGYSLEGSTCQPNGVVGACLPGTDYNSAQGCCSAPSQTEIPSSVSVCPVGTFRVAGQNTCTPNPVQGLVSVVQPVELENCTGGDPLASGGTPASGGQPTLVVVPTGEVEPTIVAVVTTEVVPTVCQEPEDQCDDYEEWDSVACRCYDPGCEPPPDGCLANEYWSTVYCSCEPNESYP